MRLIKIPALLALVVAAGLALGFASNSNAVAPVAFAAYTEFASIEDLQGPSELIVRGTVVDSGEPFLDRGLAPGAEPRPNEDPGIAMRSYQVRVVGAESKDSLISVVALDPKVFGSRSGGAVLNEGEEIFLFLAESKGEAAPPGSFFVVGGRQGLFREVAKDTWERDEDPHTEHEHEDERLHFDDDEVDTQTLEKAVDLTLLTESGVTR